MTHSVDQTAAATRSSGQLLVERREAQRSLGGLRTPTDVVTRASSLRDSQSRRCWRAGRPSQGQPQGVSQTPGASRRSILAMGNGM